MGQFDLGVITSKQEKLNPSCRAPKDGRPEEVGIAKRLSDGVEGAWR
jgi:hypothetical protein